MNVLVIIICCLAALGILTLIGGVVCNRKQSEKHAQRHFICTGLCCVLCVFLGMFA